MHAPSDQNCRASISKLLQEYKIEGLFVHNSQSFITKLKFQENVKIFIFNQKRCLVSDIAKDFGVEINVVEDCLKNINISFKQIGPELFSPDFSTEVKTSISCDLREKKRMSVSQLATAYNLTLQHILDLVENLENEKLVEKHSDHIYQIGARENFSSEILEFFHEKSSPVELYEFCNDRNLVENDVQSIISKAIKNGSIQGRIETKNKKHIYIPECHETVMKKTALDSFRSCGYVSFDFIKKLGLSPLDFKPTLEKEALKFSDFFLAKEIFEALKELLQNCLSEEKFYDFSDFLPFLTSKQFEEVLWHESSLSLENDIWVFAEGDDRAVVSFSWAKMVLKAFFLNFQENQFSDFLKQKENEQISIVRKGIFLSDMKDDFENIGCWNESLIKKLLPMIISTVTTRLKSNTFKEKENWMLKQKRIEIPALLDRMNNQMETLKAIQKYLDIPETQESDSRKTRSNFDLLKIHLFKTVIAEAYHSILHLLMRLYTDKVAEVNPSNRGEILSEILHHWKEETNEKKFLQALSRSFEKKDLAMFQTTVMGIAQKYDIWVSKPNKKKREEYLNLKKIQKSKEIRILTGHQAIAKATELFLVHTGIGDLEVPPSSWALDPLVAAICAMEYRGKEMFSQLLPELAESDGTKESVFLFLKKLGYKHEDP
eukprot:GHVP01019324.1.p1 GENE.GHVP01019324.1~~GHVP01019324.1.p1  ORF type:complete len:660 (+),score=152.85 GHVP01019324.1:19-1998(+)